MNFTVLLTKLVKNFARNHNLFNLCFGNDSQVNSKQSYKKIDPIPTPLILFQRQNHLALPFFYNFHLPILFIFFFLF